MPGRVTRPPIDPCRPKLKNHDLLRSISRGGAGEVWLARHRSSNEFNAVKFVWKDPDGDSTWYEREASAYENYQRLSEKNGNLVRIFECGQAASGQCFFYIMEVADDIKHHREIDPVTYSPNTLSYQIQRSRKEGQISAESVGNWLRGVLNGLGFLHRHSLLHLDLKPSNIIFVKGQPKLADLGLLTKCEVNDQAEPANERTAGGTLGYMAPEDRRTVRSDIYSFGKMAYELMTGLDRMNFPGLPKDFLNRPDKAQWMALNMVILQACQSAPEQRQNDVGELRNQIRRIFEGTSNKSVFLSLLNWPCFQRQKRTKI